MREAEPGPFAITQSRLKKKKAKPTQKKKRKTTQKRKQKRKQNKKTANIGEGVRCGNSKSGARPSRLGKEIISGALVQLAGLVCAE